MKIGIITVYDAVNYGSFLQAYCLQKTLNSMGDNDVTMIKDSSFLYEKWRLTSLISYVPDKIKFKSKLATGYLKGWKCFKSTRKKTGYDLIIVGSDEMWEVNNITMLPRPSFFGVGIGAKKLVTYAVSSNTTTTEDVMKYPEFIEGLKKFDMVSVRDRSTYNAYSGFVKNISYCIDPTLLCDLNEIADFGIHRENYILCYTYTFEPYMIEGAQNLAKKYNKKLIVVGQNFKWADEAIPANAFEFLGLIKKADFVITDTFHGTVLSIGLNRPFVSYAYKEKVKRILEQFELQNRNGVGCGKLDNFYDEEIDYKKVNESILQERNVSLDYLKKCLSL